MIGRREAFGVMFAAVLPRTVRGQQSGQGSVDVDTMTVVADPLRNPAAVGRLRANLEPADSDPVIIATERRLRCTCGCTLDVYTCRTTDFTCTYSPEIHKEVKALFAAGKTPEEVIGVFVAREGEAILMAPPAKGFNLAGYLVPGLVMAAGMLGLIAWIGRRRATVAAAGEGATPGAASREVAAPDADQQAALRRALEDVES